MNSMHKLIFAFIIPFISMPSWGKIDCDNFLRVVLEVANTKPKRVQTQIELKGIWTKSRSGNLQPEEIGILARHAFGDYSDFLQEFLGAFSSGLKVVEKKPDDTVFGEDSNIRYFIEQVGSVLTVFSHTKSIISDEDYNTMMDQFLENSQLATRTRTRFIDNIQRALSINIDYKMLNNIADYLKPFRFFCEDELMAFHENGVIRSLDDIRKVLGLFNVEPRWKDLIIKAWEARINTFGFEQVIGDAQKYFRILAGSGNHPDEITRITRLWSDQELNNKIASETNLSTEIIGVRISDN